MGRLDGAERFVLMGFSNIQAGAWARKERTKPGLVQIENAHTNQIHEFTDDMVMRSLL